MIRRTRVGRHPSVADSLDDWTIDGEWAQTIQDEPETFVIYDNGPDTFAMAPMHAVVCDTCFTWKYSCQHRLCCSPAHVPVVLRGTVPGSD